MDIRVDDVLVRIVSVDVKKAVIKKSIFCGIIENLLDNVFVLVVDKKDYL